MTYALVIREQTGRNPSAIREIVEGLAGRGLHVAGFTQRFFEEGPGRKAVDLTRLRDGRSLALARTKLDAGAAPGLCSFAFDEGAFAEARRWIEEDVAGADVVVVDAVGKLELGGGGHRAAIERALRAGPPVVLTVREDSLVYALEALALEAPVASFPTAAGTEALARFLDAVEHAATVFRERTARGDETTSA